MSTDPDSRRGPALARILGWGLVLVPVVFNPAGGAFVPIKRVVLYGMVCAAAFVRLRDNDRSAWTSAPALPFAAVFVFLALLSSLWSVNPLSAAVEAAQPAALLILFAFALSGLSSDDIPLIARYGAAGCGVVTVAGLLQYFGLDIGIPSAGLPSGTFSFRNTTASYLVGVLPLCVLAAVTDTDRRRRVLWAATTFAACLLLVYTRTRGAWLGAAVGCGVAALYLFLSGVNPLRALTRKPAIAAAAVVCFSALAVLDPVERASAPQKFDTVKTTAAAALGSIVDPGADRGRLVFWKNTLEMIVAHPILGVGYDNWEYAYPLFDRGEWSRSTAEPVRPHNDLLWVWSELGPAGLVAYAGFILVPIGCAFRQRGEQRVPVALTAPCIASVSALFVHGGFSFLREQPAAMLLMWTALLGLSLGQRTRIHADLPPIAIPALAVGILALVVGIAHTRFEQGFRFAVQAHREGALGPALTEVRRASANGVFDHRVIFLEGRILQQTGRNDEARAAYEAALRHHPNYANTHHNLAGVLDALGRRDAALEAYRRSLEIRPTYHEARINYANALLRSGRLEDARAEMSTLVGQTDRVPEAYGLLGAIHLHLGQFDEGIRILERAVALREDYVEAHNNLAIAYEQLGRSSDAARAYRQVERHWAGDPAYLESVRQRIRALESREGS